MHSYLEAWGLQLVKLGSGGVFHLNLYIPFACIVRYILCQNVNICEILFYFSATVPKLKPKGVNFQKELR